MPKAKFHLCTARAVIRLRARSLLRSTPKVALATALATRLTTLAQAFAAAGTLFPTLSSPPIASLNRRSHLPRAKAIYYPLS